MSELPKNTESNGSAGDQSSGGSVFIENFHYSPSDIKALTGLAQVDPDLAHKVVEQRDAEHSREIASEKLAVVVTVLLVVFGLSFVGFIVSTQGIFLTILSIPLLAVIGLVIRVALTGEWSDLKGVAYLIDAVLRRFGAKGPADDNTD